MIAIVAAAMRAGITFDLLRALPGYCPIDLTELLKQLLQAFPSIPPALSQASFVGCNMTPDLICLELPPLQPECMCFSKSWATKKSARKLFDFPLVCTLKILQATDFFF